MSTTPIARPGVRGVPEGDNRERMICAECGYILYDNPKIVVGSVARWGERILFAGARSSRATAFGRCRRAISSSTNWQAPGPSAKPGRRLTPDRDRRAAAIYDIPRISQVQLIYRARLLDEAVAAGRKASKCGSLTGTKSRGPILAFPSNRWALQHDREARADLDYTTRINPPGF